MAISFIGSASSSLTTITPPAHQAGDCFLILPFRDGSNSTPTLSPDYTQLQQNVSNSAGALFCAKLATSSSETGGTWANATNIILLVYRGVDQIRPFGGSAVATAASTTVTYPATSMTDTTGNSWVVGMAAHRSTDTTLEVAPTNMTNRIGFNDAVSELSGNDTNAGVVSWPLTTESVGGTSSGWVGFTVELVVPRGHYLNNKSLRPHPFSPGLAR